MGILKQIQAWCLKEEVEGEAAGRVDREIYKAVIFLGLLNTNLLVVFL